MKKKNDEYKQKITNIFDLKENEEMKKKISEFNEKMKK